MKNYSIILAVVLLAWVFWHHPKAHWTGELAPSEPQQISGPLPHAWGYKDFTVTPRAKYHIKAVILSKHHYWGEVEMEDTISYYDLALGWGPMSDARNINQLDISQDGRWYNYRWSKNSLIDLSEIIDHSSNNHIVAANQDVLEAVEHFKLYDLIEMEGYLVDIRSNKKDWSWHTSLSRADTGGGSCELFWVTSAFSI
jgi:hypothetical protein